jgi:hypothetical protein
MDGTDKMNVLATWPPRGWRAMPAINEAAVAQDVQSHEKDADGTKDEHRRLKHGGVHDHAHAAENGVKAGGEGQPRAMAQKTSIWCPKTLM